MNHALSLITFIPLIGMVLILAMPDAMRSMFKWVAVAATVPQILIAWWLFENFDTTTTAVQFAEKYPWIPHYNITYFMGVDGISISMILLTAIISFIAVFASFKIDKAPKAYFALLLLLDTGMMGVFASLDFFLFYVFWEVMLLPMYFLIGIWGGPRREYAAIKFFLYTLVGSVLMLIALLMFYFDSAGSVVGGRIAGGKTFDILALAMIGQGRDAGAQFSRFVKITAFILLFIGFAIKVPVFPFHTWLPDAHVEAPTPISMILAGVLLKMGGYGIIRIAFPICPQGAYYAAHALVLLGVISIIYGAFAALAQTDFKRMVAYSSVSHMGYVLLGIAVWKLTEGSDQTNNVFWNMGLNAAMFQMLAHGISSPGMFFLVGVIYDRVHHRDLNQFGGLMGLMPLYGGLAVGIFFAGMGLPGLCGFWGEAFTVLSSWNYNPLYAIIAASGVILTAGYILWTVQRVYFGAEYKGPHPEAITPITERETLVAGVLLAGCIVFGLFPGFLFSQMRGSVELLVENLSTAKGLAEVVRQMSGL